jgi:hypothetical protein
MEERLKRHHRNMYFAQDDKTRRFKREYAVEISE